MVKLLCIHLLIIESVSKPFSCLLSPSLASQNPTFPSWQTVRKQKYLICLQDSKALKKLFFIVFYFESLSLRGKITFSDILWGLGMRKKSFFVWQRICFHTSAFVPVTIIILRLLKNPYCHPRPPCREAGML